MVDEAHKDLLENEPRNEFTKEDIASVEQLQEKLALAEEDIKKQQDNYLRVLAEMENLRKRNQRDKEEYIKYANMAMVKKILPVFDDFERAIDNKDSQDYEGLHKGMELIFKKLWEIVKAEGVEPIEALGKPFNPEFHQPLMMEDSSEPENTVLEEMQKGYIMHGRLIRPSLVKVSN
ncbi:MAG: nucleotide exchange factor GrpE [Syntrophomonadaceae bacterium]|nr:nucleotide exchange factor GrpE [Syntrophomonadaceae bacterium]